MYRCIVLLCYTIICLSLSPVNGWPDEASKLRLGLLLQAAFLDAGAALNQSLLALDPPPYDGLPINAALLNGVTTSNAGQAAKRPLDSGLTLDKTFATIPGWRPLSVKESIKHWVATPRGKALGE